MTTGTTQGTTDRIFVYDGKEFADPGDQYSNEQVRNMLAQTFGALRNGEIEVEEGSNRVILKPAAKHLGSSYKKVYTFGYTGQSRDRLVKLVEELGAIVIDTRYSAQSRHPHWRKRSMEETLGGSYLHCPLLGNVNYKNGGDIKINDMDGGLRVVRPFVRYAPIILLCACINHETCHRAVVAQEMAEQWGVEVEHIEIEWERAA